MSQNVISLKSELTDFQLAAISDIAKQTKRNTRLVYSLAVSLFLDVALTFGLGFTLNRVQTQASELDVVQETQGHEVLCPLYQIFLDTKPPVVPEDKVHAYEVIVEGYNKLGC
jgi:hypothetical protein